MDSFQCIDTKWKANNLNQDLVQSPEAVEYTECISTEE